jgi:hypothetical protein
MTNLMTKILAALGVKFDNKAKAVFAFKYAGRISEGYPDILPKDILPKTFCRTHVLPNGQFADNNAWDCDLFLNCVILNHCVK